MNRFLRLLIVLAVLGVASTASGGGPGAPRDQLGRDEQEQLKPVRNRWEGMPPERQERLRGGGRSVAPDDAR